MTDFSKLMEKAKEIESKMKESQENIKKMRVEGVSGSNSVKIILDGNGGFIFSSWEIFLICSTVSFFISGLIFSLFIGIGVSSFK